MFKKKRKNNYACIVLLIIFLIFTFLYQFVQFSITKPRREDENKKLWPPKQNSPLENFPWIEKEKIDKPNYKTNKTIKIYNIDYEKFIELIKKEEYISLNFDKNINTIKTWFQVFKEGSNVSFDFDLITYKYENEFLYKTKNVHNIKKIKKQNLNAYPKDWDLIIDYNLKIKSWRTWGGFGDWLQWYDNTGPKKWITNEDWARKKESNLIRQFNLKNFYHFQQYQYREEFIYFDYFAYWFKNNKPEEIVPIWWKESDYDDKKEIYKNNKEELTSHFITTSLPDNINLVQENWYNFHIIWSIPFWERVAFTMIDDNHDFWLGQPSYVWEENGKTKKIWYDRFVPPLLFEVIQVILFSYLKVGALDYWKNFVRSARPIIKQIKKLEKYSKVTAKIVDYYWQKINKIEIIIKNKYELLKKAIVNNNTIEEKILQQQIDLLKVTKQNLTTKVLYFAELFIKYEKEIKLLKMKYKPLLKKIKIAQDLYYKKIRPSFLKLFKNFNNNLNQIKEKLKNIFYWRGLNTTNNFEIMFSRFFVKFSEAIKIASKYFVHFFSIIFFNDLYSSYLLEE